MFDKRSLLRKLKNNKILVLVISVVVVSVVYYGIDKAIDSYDFKNNKDINLVYDEATDGSEGKYDESNGRESDGSLGISSEGGGSTESEDNLKEKIYIYITGEVNTPGVVILNEGSRITDAINAAGGTTSNANISKVNLVYVLEDGMKINIPNNNDLKNNPNFEYITKNSGDGADDYNNSVSSNSTGSGDGGLGSVENGNVGSSGGSKSEVGRYDIVNINTATQTELESLPGIGPSLALKIISYRKENGKFSSIEEIKNVNGIGESKFEALKKYIRV